MSGKNTKSIETVANVAQLLHVEGLRDDCSLCVKKEGVLGLQVFIGMCWFIVFVSYKFVE